MEKRALVTLGKVYPHKKGRNEEKSHYSEIYFLGKIFQKRFEEVLTSSGGGRDLQRRNCKGQVTCETRGLNAGRLGKKSI